MGVFKALREQMASICGLIFEATINPMMQMPEIVAGAVARDGSDPVLGSAMTSFVSGIGDMASQIGNGLQSTGYALCFLFFLISLLELAMSERMTLEYFIKFMSKMVVGFVAVYYWEDIYNTCCNLGPALVAKVNEVGGGSGASCPAFQEKFIEFVGENGAASWLPLLIGTLIIGGPLFLCALGVIAVVYVVVFTWIFEMSIRGAFLPIACALLSDDGWRGTGGRYIKRFLAVCSQGAVMTAIAKISSAGMGAVVGSLASALSGGLDSMTTSIFAIGSSQLNFIFFIAQTAIVVVAMAFATVSVMFKATSIVNDVFGG